MANKNNFFGFKKNLEPADKKKNRKAGIKVMIRSGWLVRETPTVKENKSKILKTRDDSLNCHHFTVRKIISKVKKIFKV